MQKRPAPKRFGIGHMAVLIAGVTFGFWLLGLGVGEDIGPAVGAPGREINPYGIIVGVLGGLSVVGPPLLLLARKRERRRFGPGELIWFTQGTSAWLLWPPIVVNRMRPAPGPGSTAAICFAYGTPLMAIYLGAALLFGGWIRVGKKRRRARSWRETFGLLLGVLWACTGGYCLYIIWGSR